ncbi:MAG: glycerol-3-phosphate responsive antiterminator [Lachnospiraceae bacterium]|nr:glycerol-3-phosphate responsive antiterminator [Lachnospiraceae bacterium]
MDKGFYELLEANPVIAAVKDEAGLAAACKSAEIQVVFLLFGDILNVARLVRSVKDAGKAAVVHIDLVSGLGAKEVVVDFLKAHTAADGVISTRPGLVKRAGELSLWTVLRIFLLDSMALENLERQALAAHPDVIEILPGLMPKVISKVVQRVHVPVIAGGLISEKEDVIEALDAGAVAVSTTNPAVWEM